MFGMKPMTFDEMKTQLVQHNIKLDQEALRDRWRTLPRVPSAKGRSVTFQAHSKENQAEPGICLEKQSQTVPPGKSEGKLSQTVSQAIPKVTQTQNFTLVCETMLNGEMVSRAFFLNHPQTTHPPTHTKYTQCVTLIYFDLRCISQGNQGKSIMHSSRVRNCRDTREHGGGAPEHRGDYQFLP